MRAEDSESDQDVPRRTPDGCVQRTVDLWLLVGQRRAAESRSSTAISKAFWGAFQRMVRRRRPLPVGSSAISAMQTHFSAACSLGKCPRARTALRMRALTHSIALVEQMTLRISTSKAAETGRDTWPDGDGASRCNNDAASHGDGGGRLRWF